MPTVSEIRHANLMTLIERAGSIQVFADQVDRSHSQISQLKNRSKHSKSGERREVGDEISRHIERCLELPIGWMDVAHPQSGGGLSLSRGMAHDMSHARRILPLTRYAWEDLMNADLSQPFELVVGDDSLAPEIFKGCIARLDPARAPVAGRPVLVRDREGSHYLRDYQQGAGGAWQAVARQRGYAPLDSVADGLTVIATLKGYDWP